MGRNRRRWFALAGAAAAALAVLGGLTAPSPASAEDSGTSVISSDGLTSGYTAYNTGGGETYFVYAKAGEWLEVWAAYGDGDSSTAATVEVVAPDGTTTSQQFRSAAARTPFQVTAATEGVWRITFDPGSAEGSTRATRWAINVFASEPTAPNGNWGTYNPISGTPIAATRVTGRVWSEDYGVTHVTSPASFSNDLRFYLINDSGYLYRLTLRDYNGLNSAITATSLGVPEGGDGSASCTPSYHSWESPATAAAPAASCAEPFRIFFELPNDDLPASAPIWDATLGAARAQTIKPAPFDPVTATVSGWGFSRTDPSGAAGTLTYSLGSAFGAHELQLDLNGNGSFDDPEDRSVTLQAAGETIAYAFDGKDGLGNAVAACQPITAQVHFDHVGEIHVVQADVEKRGSIELLRLNGPSEGRSTIYWDDTAAYLTESRTNTTPVLDGTAGVDSTGGVHGWGGGGGGWAGNGWGNERWIDDWAYLPVDKTVGSYEIPTGCTPVLTVDPAQPTTNDGTPLFHPGQDVTLRYDCVAGSTSGTVTATPAAGGAAVTGTVTNNGDGTCTVALPPLAPNGAWTVDLSLDYGGTSVGTSSAIYLDPSGIVVDEQHALVEGATVTLWRSDTEDGTYVQVPDGSLIMSASNRSNPSTTGADGSFSWDVTGGWYRIVATKTVDGVTYTGSTDPMQVPPERTGIVIVLRGLHAAMTGVAAVDRLADTGYEAGPWLLGGGLLLLVLGAAAPLLLRRIPGRR